MQFCEFFLLRHSDYVARAATNSFFYPWFLTRYKIICTTLAESIGGHTIATSCSAVNMSRKVRPGTNYWVYVNVVGSLYLLKCACRCLPACFIVV